MVAVITVALRDYLSLELTRLLFFAGLGGFALLVGLLMANDGILTVRELVKQIAVWLGIIVLLPMSVWYGTSAVSPPP